MCNIAQPRVFLPTETILTSARKRDLECQLRKRQDLRKSYRDNVGFQVLPGTAGKAGPEGEKGDTGPPGIEGDKGVKGATGSRGIGGPRGQTGSDGPQGAVGPAGRVRNFKDMA